MVYIHWPAWSLLRKSGNNTWCDQGAGWSQFECTTPVHPANVLLAVVVIAHTHNLMWFWNRFYRSTWRSFPYPDNQLVLFLGESQTACNFHNYYLEGKFKPGFMTTPGIVRDRCPVKLLFLRWMKYFALFFTTMLYIYDH